jgi:alpha 1,3-glucosidase
MVMVAGLCGMPFIGADIGGFTGTPGEQMIVRWYQTAAWVYPFMRSHCSISEKFREPWEWPEETYQRIKRIINNRYSLLGFWYTHAMLCLETGRSPVVPLWVEFPEDGRSHEVDHEVLVGDALLVTPVLDDGADHVDLYLPPGLWYDFATGSIAHSESHHVEIDDIPVQIRGGRIIPFYQKPGEVSALESITKPLTLIIALTLEEHSAEGTIYLDDGVSYGFRKNHSFVHRKFTAADGFVVTSKKVDSDEGEVPEFLSNVVVGGFVFYQAWKNGTSTVTRFENLNLKLKDEWTWHPEHGMVVVGDGREKRRSEGVVITLIVSAAVVVCVVVAVIGMVVIKRQEKELVIRYT